MLCWEGYDFPDQFQDLKTERNFEVSGTYIGNNDEIFTKIKAGGYGTYDVTTPFMWTVTADSILAKIKRLHDIAGI